MGQVGLRYIGVPLVGGVLTLSLSLYLRAGLANSVFLAVLAGLLLFVVQLTWFAYRDARKQQRRAEELARASATDVARVAVNAEREHLSRDIEAWLREVLLVVAVRARAATSDEDPRAEVLAIQLDAQRATSELRRQLGLLRPLEQQQTAVPTDTRAAPAPLRVSDVVLAVAIAALALTESLTYGRMEGTELAAGSVVLTTSVALSTLGRRIAPIPSALVCSALLATGALLGQPVYDGFWFPVAVGTLAWALTGLQSRAGWLMLIVLIGATLASRWLYTPENVLINAVCLSVAVLGAAAVARSRRLRTSAHLAAARRSEELQVAADEAVRAERFQVARELHDAVSHAVSVIAVQAGAAELLWPTDSAAARQAIDVIESTATQAVAELDRLLPGRSPIQRTMSDVWGLVARMEAAGLAVRARYDGEAPPALVPTVYRVVQESLTNALRYAQDGAVDIEVSTTGEGDTTTVRVTTHGSVAAEPSRRGYGLVGLGERVAQCGGSLEISQGASSDAFEVTAVLPRPSAAAVS